MIKLIDLLNNIPYEFTVNIRQRRYYNGKADDYALLGISPIGYAIHMTKINKGENEDVLSVIKYKDSNHYEIIIDD